MLLPLLTAPTNVTVGDGGNAMSAAKMSCDGHAVVVM